MKFEYRSLICKITSVVCFGLFLFLLSKFVLQGFGSINHLAVFGLNQNLGGGKIISIIAFAIFLSFFVSSKFSFYLIVFPIAFLSALYSPIASVYGAPDYQSFVSLLATNFSEATEFLSLIPMKEYGKSLLIIVLALLCHLIAFKAKIKPWKNKTYVLLSCAFLVIVLEPTLFVRKLYSAGEVTKEQLAELDKYSAKSSWQKSERTGVPTDYVLIIGESARKDYFHSYGYPVENTPFLDNNFTVKVDGMKSGGTYTIGSLTNMLTVPDKGKWKPRYDRSIIDLAKSAGIRTYWLSNQGMVGKFDTPVSAIGRKADKAIFLNKGDYSEKNISDFALLKPFKQILDQKTDQSRLIILHTLGSHPNVCKRILDIKNPYTTWDKNLSYVACYVTSIKKTDQLIEKVFELLKKEKSVTGRPFSIIYFSDHGLAHKTEKNKITLTNNFASKFHYDIPLIKIDSDRNDRIELSSEKSGLNFTEGLGNWMNIQNLDLPKTSLFDGKNDLTDYGLKEKVNLISTPKDPAIDLTGKLE